MVRFFRQYVRNRRARVSFYKKSNFHCPLVAVTSYRLPSVGFPIVANNLPSSSNEPPLLAAPGVVHKLGTALKRSNDETKGWKKKKRKTKQKQRGKKAVGRERPGGSFFLVISFAYMAIDSAAIIITKGWPSVIFVFLS